MAECSMSEAQIGRHCFSCGRVPPTTTSMVKDGNLLFCNGVCLSEDFNIVQKYERRMAKIAKWKQEDHVIGYLIPSQSRQGGKSRIIKHD